MLKIAIQDFKKLEVSDMELNLNQTLMPIEIFDVISKKYKKIKITLY